MKGWNIQTQKNPLIEITGLGLFLEAFGVKKSIFSELISQFYLDNLFRWVTYTYGSRFLLISRVYFQDAYEGHMSTEFQLCVKMLWCIVYCVVYYQFQVCVSELQSQNTFVTAFKRFLG